MTISHHNNVPEVNVLLSINTNLIVPLSCVDLYAWELQTCQWESSWCCRHHCPNLHGANCTTSACVRADCIHSAFRPHSKCYFTVEILLECCLCGYTLWLFSLEGTPHMHVKNSYSWDIGVIDNIELKWY